MPPPTPQDIPLPQIGGPRPVAGYDVSGYAQGAQALARSGQQLAAGLEHAGSQLFEEQLYQDRNDLLLRQRQANADAHQYVASARNNPDATPEVVNNDLAAIYDNYAPPGGGPRGQHYQAMTAGVRAETVDQFGQYYHNRRANEMRADFIDRINELQNTATFEENPIHTSNVRILGMDIKNAEQAHYLLPTESERYQRNLVNGVFREHYRKGLDNPETRETARAQLKGAYTAGMKAWEGLLPAEYGGAGFVSPLVPQGGAAPAPGRGAAVTPAIDAWRAAGMPDHGIAGVLHNIKEESGFDPTLRHPDQPNWGGEAHFAHGLYQEGGAEWNHYQSWLGANHPGADWRDAGLQSQFAAWNLKTNYPATWQKMVSASTPEQAASIYASEYLKPALPYLRSRIQSINARGVAPLAAYGAQGGAQIGAQAGGPGTVDFPSASDRGGALAGNGTDVLGGAQIQALLQHARALDSAEYVDNERAIRVQEQAEKLRVESVKDEYHKDIFGGSPTKTLTQAENDSRLDGHPEAREWIRAAFERAGRGDPVHTTSQKASNEFERRMDLPWGDPEKLTDIAEIRKAHYGDPANGIAPTLSNADADHLEKRFNDQRTESGSKWDKDFVWTLGAVKPKIAKEEIPLGLFDTEAGERLNMWRQQVNGLRQQYIKANKDPSDLLNSNKPDYVGSDAFLKPFRADQAKLIARLLSNKVEEAKDKQPNAPLPPAPEGVDKKGWEYVVSRPPFDKDTGETWSRAKWGAFFEAFRNAEKLKSEAGNSTEADKAEFKKWSGGYDFDELNARLAGKSLPAVGGAPATRPSAATAGGVLTGSRPTPVTVAPTVAPAASPAPNAAPAPPANETPEARRQRFEAEAAESQRQSTQRQSAEDTQQRTARAAALAETRRASQEQIAGRKMMRAEALAEGARAFNERLATGTVDAARAHLDELGRQEALLADNIKTWRTAQEDRNAAPGDRTRAALRADKLESELAAVRAERERLKK
jgi:hypothetical protein